MLLKVDPSTQWYKLLVETNAHFAYFNERLKFDDSKDAANFPSMLVFLSKNNSKKINLEKNKSLEEF